MKNIIVEKKLFIDYLLNTLSKSKHMNNSKEKKIISEILKKFPLLKKNIQKSWENIYNQNNINWNKISNVNIEYKIRFIEKTYDEKSDIYVTFDFNSKKYKFKLDDCLKLNNKWYIFDELRWYDEVK